MQKIKIEQRALGCGMWMVAWIFTIGFLQLSFWQGVWAVIAWPYYIGSFLRVFWNI